MSATSIFWFLMILAAIAIVLGHYAVISPLYSASLNQAVLWILLALLGWKGPFGAMVK